MQLTVKVAHNGKWFTAYKLVGISQAAANEHINIQSNRLDASHVRVRVEVAPDHAGADILPDVDTEPHWIGF